jgi:hypothetical protein
MRKYIIIQDSLHEMSYLFGITVSTVNARETVSNNMQRKCHDILWCTVQYIFRIYQENAWRVPISTVFCLIYALLTYLLIYLLTYLLTSWNRVHLEELAGSKLVKKFTEFYGTRRFIIAFTSACQLFLSWARSIQPMHSHPTSLRSILIYYPPFYAWVFQVVSFPQVSAPNPVHTSALWCTSTFNEDS